MAEKRLTMANYGDFELFGPRVQTNKLIACLKAGNDSECILFSVGTFAAKEESKLKDLIGTDKRLRQMIQGLGIEHAVPIQRYSWPKILKSPFPNLFVSAESTGKTYAHLLYVVAKCIALAPPSEVEELLNGVSNCYITNEHSSEDLVTHPKYIIICSHQDRVESIYRSIDYMKEKAYGSSISSSKRHALTPVSGTLKLDHDNEKLAQRCSESDILISNPQTLIKCLKQNLINFAKCKKIFFDDLDLTLQLQNNFMRELIKIYLIHVQNVTDTAPNQTCRVHMFASKWTNLVKQFLSSIFPQRTVLFSSIAEAAIYSNIQYEVEIFGEYKKAIDVLSNVLQTRLEECSKVKQKIAIVCKSDDEAQRVSDKLRDMGFESRLIRENSDESGLLSMPYTKPAERRNISDNLFVISDSALVFEVEFSTRKRPLNDIMHLIHASLPDDMLVFDQRFRLLYKNIQDMKSGMTSTIILNTMSSFKLAKQIYDLASRSSTTLSATKYLLRNLIPADSNQICWRWATTGLCRLEKLSKNDYYGSYCHDRHAIRDFDSTQSDKSTPINYWPGQGMVRITVTHIISPSEFYFLFEAYKNDDGKWVNYKSSGLNYMKEIQSELDLLRNVKKRSVPLCKIRKGSIHGVYFPQESRVDRVMILDEPEQGDTSSMVNEELEYSKQISIFKIDHGVCLDVYVKNLIELPENLVNIPSQCHRGFHIGFKPTDNEPNWLYKSKKKFFDICVSNQAQDVIAWIRLKHESCFWFEHMLISRKLTNTDSNDTWLIDPLAEMRKSGLAEPVNSELSILPASRRLETIGRWNNTKLIKASRFAFLRRDLEEQNVYLLSINQSTLGLILRQQAYNKQLIDLEQLLYEEFADGKLVGQKHIVTEAICIANIQTNGPPEQCFNRVKIIQLQDFGEQDIEAPSEESSLKAYVECLDHGDKYWVPTRELYQASVTHLTRLPFQAIKCDLANLNNALLDRTGNIRRIVNGIYDLTRHEDNNMKILKCKLSSNGKVYLYVPNESTTLYEPLYTHVRDKLGEDLHDHLDDTCRMTFEAIAPFMTMSPADGRASLVLQAIDSLLMEAIKQTMDEANKPSS